MSPITCSTNCMIVHLYLQHRRDKQECTNTGRLSEAGAKKEITVHGGCIHGSPSICIGNLCRVLAHPKAIGTLSEINS